MPMTSFRCARPRSSAKVIGVLQTLFDTDCSVVQVEIRSNGIEPVAHDGATTKHLPPTTHQDGAR